MRDSDRLGGADMKRACAVLVLSIVVFLCGRSKSFGSVGGLSGGSQQCGSSGRLYRNLTRQAMQFELLFSANAGTVAGCSSTSLTWTDAQAHQQTITVKYGYSTIVSTSLPAGGTIAWSSVSTSGESAFFFWELQRGEAAIVGTSAGSPFPINSLCESGLLYTNLTDRPVELDLAVWDDCSSGTVSWTDGEGQAQTLNPGSSAQGVTTSLPAGGTISFAGNGNSDATLSWVVERVRVRPGNESTASPESQ
jgi:hypothetical protein